MSESSNVKTWLPLESIPEVLQSASNSYGVKDIIVSDIYGEDLLDMVPQPVGAVVFVYSLDNDIDNNLDIESTLIDMSLDTNKDSIFFAPQRIGNACCSFALFHGILNSSIPFTYNDNSPIDLLYKTWKNKTSPGAETSLSEYIENSNDIETIHRSHEVLGSLDAEKHENTQTHYIVFVSHNNRLYRLDGRKTGPYDHGECTSDELLLKATRLALSHAQRVNSTEQALLALSHDSE